jgi:AcrR family transcriptional regulator
MPRPRSDERRSAILAAATRVVGSQGLGAATAAIAKESGVSNGSLFVYFDTKVTLFNELYVTLKTEMADAASADLPSRENPREQVHHLWNQWLRWATSNPDKRRVLAQLDVADEISHESHQLVSAAQSGTASLIERCRVDGPMAEVPLHFVMVLIVSMADATMDAIIGAPEQSQTLSEIAFEAVWRVLAG